MKHHCKYVSKRLALLLMVLFVGTFTLTGCGSGGGSSDNYSTPGTLGNTVPLEGQTSNTLIDTATLKAWIDQGLVNAGGFTNVVILQQKNYADGHIEGAQEWANSGIVRDEGPIKSGNMVLDGTTMDAMLCERGINANSTIVFMGNNSERTYFMFRYWGFPKNQLKILNGGTKAWTADGHSLTTAAPVVATTTFSVKDLGNGPDLNTRASLNEMIVGVEDGTIAPYATYGVTLVTSRPTITETVDNSGAFVAFQGSIDGLLYDDALWNDTATNITGGLYDNVGGVLYYKSKADMEAYLAGLGADKSKAIATYCRAGNLASDGYGPMEAVLDDWNIMLYDGSWSQWGSLTADVTAVPTSNHALPAGYEAWATDVLAGDVVDTAAIAYNVDLITGTQKVYQPEFIDAPLSPRDAGANTLEDADYEYWAAPAAGGSAPGAAGGGGGGGC
ncbi:MAG: selenite/tellurite reduction operon rhodanese-like protein ExtH [Desulfuromonadaceae bacterium]|nr:selenite/tellurite reduction operon rhodanese-like protein ExtH [Desulfuromonadaceae bacterium]